MFRLIGRMLWRDLRAGELHLLGLAIVVAVASLTSVGFLADRVERGLEREANQLLGGDLLLRADHPLDARFIQEAQQRGLQVATTILFTSMAGTEHSAALTGVKAVEAGYPLRGGIRIAAAPNASDAPVDRVPEQGEVWLDERLFAELDVKKGDVVHFGRLPFRVGGVVTFESDRGTNFFSLLPRAIFNIADLPATELLTAGSRAVWRLHVAGTPRAIEAYQDWLKSNLQPGEALETVENARPEVRASLDQAQRFLRLTALLAVILAAVAVGLSARRFMIHHLDGCAVMRCMGAQQKQVITLVTGEFLLFGLSAALFGSGLGWLTQWGIGSGLHEVLGITLPAPSLLPLLHGVLVGVALLAGFVLPQVLRLGRVSTLRVLRREFDVIEPMSGVAWFLGLGVLLGLAFWIARDVRLGVWVAGGFALSLGVFMLVAWGGIRLLTRIKGEGSVRGGGWRYGVAALSRRMGSSVIQIAALGLGMTALLLLTSTQGDLLDSWKRMTSESAPNRFVINIQPDQKEALQRFFRDEGLSVPEIEPMIRGRLVAINGQSVQPDSYAEARTRRLVEREFNLSYAHQFPQGNELVAGQWHGMASMPQFSVEKGLMEALRLKLGDQIRFEINGQTVEAPITSVRALNWDSMRVNFFVIAAEGMIENYPASLITSFHLPVSNHEFTPKLVAAFPNLTVIDVAAVLEQVRGMTEKLVVIVRFVFGFALLAGLVVLYAALQATHDEREYELAMLRTLGARHAQVRQALLAEFGVLGGMAGLLAGVGATALGWGLGHFVFKMDYVPAFGPLVFAIVLGSVGVMLGGWFGIRRLLSSPPLVSLRALR